MPEKVILTVTNDIAYDQRMIKTATTLAQMGYAVEIVGRQKKDSQPLPERPFKQTRLSCWFEKGKLFYLEYNLRLYFYLNKQSFNRIIAVDLDTIIPAYHVGKNKQAKSYYDAHEYFPEMPEVERRKAVQWIWIQIEKRYVPCFDYAYTVSNGLQQIFQSKYKKPFALIRNLPYYKPSIPVAQGQQYMLYQGALNEGRGLETLLLALTHLPHVQVKLAGEGDLSELLRNLVVELKLENQVTFLGYVLPDQLKEITSKAYIGLNLLENRGLNYYHSLANKFFDYTMAGVPSINMDFPEYRALQNTYHHTHLIPTLSVELVKEAIEKLYHDTDYYETLHQNCLKARETLNWDKESEKFKTELHF